MPARPPPMLKLVQSARLPSIFPKAWGTGDNQRRHWNLSTLFFAHACSWKTGIRRISLRKKCQNTYCGAVWFRLIVHWAWWSVRRCAITQPDGLLSRQRPGTGQQAEPEAPCRVKTSAQFLPLQVWTPRGGFKGPLQRQDGGQPLQLFVQVSLGLFFGHISVKWGKRFTQQR